MYIERVLASLCWTFNDLLIRISAEIVVPIQMQPIHCQYVHIGSVHCYVHCVFLGYFQILTVLIGFLSMGRKENRERVGEAHQTMPVAQPLRNPGLPGTSDHDLEEITMTVKEKRYIL